MFCSVAHSIFNFFALLQNYSLNEYFIKSIDGVASPSSWALEIFSFVASSLIILCLFFKFKNNFDGGLQPGG